MQKILKNWIFTMVTAILLAVLTVLVFLDAFGVGDLFFVQEFIHILTAVALLIYVIFAVIPMLPRYRHGGVRVFLCVEIAVLVFTVFAQAASSALRIPFFSTMQACSVFGLALWLGCSTQMIRAYLVRGDEAQKQVPLWQFCVYNLLGAVGVWQMVDPLITNRYFSFVIGGLALVFTGIFCFLTVQNRRALPPKPQKGKETEPMVATEPAAELQAPAAEAATEAVSEPAEASAADEAK